VKEKVDAMCEVNILVKYADAMNASAAVTAAVQQTPSEELRQGKKSENTGEIVLQLVPWWCTVESHHDKEHLEGIKF
jgi:hypothetical protein